jgi:hypothetical protein
MFASEAEALIPNDKIQYWDDRIATVITNNTTDQQVSIQFDADPDPKPTAMIKYWDFARAEKVTAATVRKSKVQLVLPPSLIDPPLM